VSGPEGKLIVFGNVPNAAADVAAAYNPAANRGVGLQLPANPCESPLKAVWTGKEMLVWGAFNSLASTS
jgi:hypothetical protein